METTDKTFADRLKAYRLARGLTQEQLANTLTPKVSEQTIKNWEKMRRWPEPPSIDSLAKALGCRPWELLKNPGDQATETKESILGALVVDASTLDKDELLEVRNLAKDFVDRRLRKSRNLEQKKPELK